MEGPQLLAGVCCAFATSTATPATPASPPALGTCIGRRSFYGRALRWRRGRRRIRWGLFRTRWPRRDATATTGVLHDWPKWALDLSYQLHRPHGHAVLELQVDRRHLHHRARFGQPELYDL